MLSLDTKAEEQERNQDDWDSFQDVPVLTGESKWVRTKFWCLVVVILWGWRGEDRTNSIY